MFCFCSSSGSGVFFLGHDGVGALAQFPRPGACGSGARGTGGQPGEILRLSLLFSVCFSVSFYLPVSLPLSLSVSLSPSVSLSLSLRPSLCLSKCLSPSYCLSASLPLCLSVSLCLCISLSLCLLSFLSSSAHGPRARGRSLSLSPHLSLSPFHLHPISARRPCRVVGNSWAKPLPQNKKVPLSCKACPSALGG